MLTRSQIMLDSKTKQDLKYLSKVTGKSMSELIREMLADAIAKETKKSKAKPTGKELLLKIKDIAVKGPGDSEYDKYMYVKDW